MNTTLQDIKARRSVRHFKADPVPQELIDQIIEAGLYAPSGMGTQNPIVIQVTEKTMRDKIAELNAEVGGREPDFDPFYGAPAILIVLGKKEIRNHVCDGALVLGNMLLAAHTLGLGGCWINRAREEFNTPWGKKLLSSLGIEGEYEGVGHVALGYVDGEYPVAPPRKSGRVYYIK